MEEKLIAKLVVTVGITESGRYTSHLDSQGQTSYEQIGMAFRAALTILEDAKQDVVSKLTVEQAARVQAGFDGFKKTSTLTTNRAACHFGKEQKGI